MRKFTLVNAIWCVLEMVTTSPTTKAGLGNDDCFFMSRSHQVSDLLSYFKTLQPVLSEGQGKGKYQLWGL